MATNFLDQLAETEVPPTPEHFEDGLHERLNQALTTSHLLTFVARSVPYVLKHLWPAALFLVRFTISGELNRASGNETNNDRLNDDIPNGDNDSDTI